MYAQFSTFYKSYIHTYHKDQTASTLPQQPLFSQDIGRSEMEHHSDFYFVVTINCFVHPTLHSRHAGRFFYIHIIFRFFYKPFSNFFSCHTHRHLSHLLNLTTCAHSTFFLKNVGQQVKNERKNAKTDLQSHLGGGGSRRSSRASGGLLLLLHGGVGWAQTGASNGIEHTLHLWGTADEGLAPEAVLDVLDQLDERDEQAPL